MQYFISFIFKLYYGIFNTQNTQNCIQCDEFVYMNIPMIPKPQSITFRSFLVSLHYFFFLVRKINMKFSLLTHFEMHNTVLLIISTLFYNRPSPVTLVWTTFHIKNMAFVFRWIKISISIWPFNKCLLIFKLYYFVGLAITGIKWSMLITRSTIIPVNIEDHF